MFIVLQRLKKKYVSEWSVVNNVVGSSIILFHWIIPKLLTVNKEGHNDIRVIKTAVTIEQRTRHLRNRKRKLNISLV
jgi:hypothetical protein